MITHIMAVSLIVRTVTNLATGSQDVGQKVMEPIGKDHAKRRNNRKRRMMRQRGSIKRKGKTERTRPYTMTWMTNPEHQILCTWQPPSLPILDSTGFSTAAPQPTYVKTYRHS